MNIDSVARLIEASSFTEFRTIAYRFLQMIGLVSAQYCDGPYDGGMDFSLPEREGGLRPGVQISVEDNWQSKLWKDVRKQKKNFKANLVYFVSSRRIPEHSFEDVKSEIFASEGVSVIRYDNQSIATKFLKENSLDQLFNILGISVATDITSSLKKYRGAASEAVAAMMVFGEQARDLRKSMFGELIKAVLHRSETQLSREALADDVIQNNGLSSSQKQLIQGHVDRLLQTRELVLQGGIVTLPASELERFDSLERLSDYQIGKLYESVHAYLMSEHVDVKKGPQELLIGNLLELATCLVTHQFSQDDKGGEEYEIYSQVLERVTSHVGKEKARAIFTGLAEVVAKSDFAKDIVAAKLYAMMLNSNSDQIAMALGGTGISVLIDASVAIPMLCGLVYESTLDRPGHSARLLYELIREHEFTAIVPRVYVEEFAAHLIEACRQYGAVLDAGISIPSSNNAFVSHFSSYADDNGLTFDEYAAVFGVRAKLLRGEVSDAQFYHARDRAVVEITALLARYGIGVVETKGWTKVVFDGISSAVEKVGYQRPEVLIKHDASVVTYLSGNEIPSDQAKILCTWDRILYDQNPDGGFGYVVMNPVATIDLFAIAKGRRTDYPLSTLMDFARLQTEESRALADAIWDQIASVEAEALSDAKLFSIARQFKEKYVTNGAMVAPLDEKNIAQAWLAWKNSRLTA